MKPKEVCITQGRLQLKSQGKAHPKMTPPRTWVSVSDSSHPATDSLRDDLISLYFNSRTWHGNEKPLSIRCQAWQGVGHLFRCPDTEEAGCHSKLQDPEVGQGSTQFITALDFLQGGALCRTFDNFPIPGSCPLDGLLK